MADMLLRVKELSASKCSRATHCTYLYSYCETLIANQIMLLGMGRPSHVPHSTITFTQLLSFIILDKKLKKMGQYSPLYHSAGLKRLMMRSLTDLLKSSFSFEQPDLYKFPSQDTRLNMCTLRLLLPFALIKLLDLCLRNEFLKQFLSPFLQWFPPQSKYV